ncbi:MAG: energy transducer TonB [Candidatus Acidiferrales bacterium]
MQSIARCLRVSAVLSLGLAIFAGSAFAQEQEEVKRVRVGGDVQQAKLLKSNPPAYPVLARRARIEGTVRLQAVISKDGSVRKVEVISGHAVLAQAASEAVQQWRYKPTELNGEPVEVVTNIDVVFKLS